MSCFTFMYSVKMSCARDEDRGIAAVGFRWRSGSRFGRSATRNKSPDTLNTTSGGSQSRSGRFGRDLLLSPRIGGETDLPASKSLHWQSYPVPELDNCTSFSSSAPTWFLAAVCRTCLFLKQTFSRRVTRATSLAMHPRERSRTQNTQRLRTNSK